MMKKLLLVGLAVLALGLTQATPVSAGEQRLETTASQTAPSDLASSAASLDVEQEEQTARNWLPQTSSMLTLIVLIGCVGICLGSLLMQFRKPVPVGNR